MQPSTPYLMLTAYDIEQRCSTKNLDASYFDLQKRNYCWANSMLYTIAGWPVPTHTLYSSTHAVKHILTKMFTVVAAQCTLPATNPYVALTQAPANAVKQTVLYLK